MFEKRVPPAEEQKEFWIATQDLPVATAGAFYNRLESTLKKIGFAEKVWEICEPAYADESRGGRPGIDPVVYFKMLMIGFFEDLPSERAIASRCADSLSLRAFLGYSLTEATPEHSSLSVIRSRLSKEQFQAVHLAVLEALFEHGLLRGRKLGIDSSVIEANASLRALQNRNTKEEYWEYVKKLAQEAGVDPEDPKAVRRFDKKRPGRKTSNEEWQNPHDPEAKVGKTKHGACEMIYKPEHIADLETGAIVAAEVRAGDAGDTQDLSVRVMKAIVDLEEVCAADEEVIGELGRQLAGDEGYFSLVETAILQEAGVEVIIADPKEGRRRKDLSEAEREVLERAKTARKSEEGKKLLRRRGELIERAFCHLLDHGGLRRTTLRGNENLTKRYLAGVVGYNLSLLLRTLFGIGTPKQWLAKVKKGQNGPAGAFCVLRWLTARVIEKLATLFSGEFDLISSPRLQVIPTHQNTRFSTGC